MSGRNFAVSKRKRTSYKSSIAAAKIASPKFSFGGRTCGRNCSSANSNLIVIMHLLLEPGNSADLVLQTSRARMKENLTLVYIYIYIYIMLPSIVMSWYQLVFSCNIVFLNTEQMKIEMLCYTASTFSDITHPPESQQYFVAFFKNISLSLYIFWDLP